MKSENVQIYVEFRICFVDIGLENVAVAEARVVGLASRRDKKGALPMTMFIIRVRNSSFRWTRKRATPGIPPKAFFTSDNPTEQTLFGEFSRKYYCPQTNMFKNTFFFFFSFFLFFKKNTLKVLLYIYGDHLGPKIPEHLKTNGPYENCSHF